MTSDFYSDFRGKKQPMDLDNVIRILRGWSALKSGWMAYVIYIPASGAFVELLSSPPDIRGNSKEDAVQIDDDYLKATFGVTDDQLSFIRLGPLRWVFLDLRNKVPLG